MIRLFAIFSLASIFVLQAPSLPAPDGRKSIAHEVVRITGKETLNPAEVSVVINPTNPQQIKAVSYSIRGSVICASEDGGSTWKTTAFPQPGNTRQQGDDLFVYGGDGTLYHACIRFVGIRMKKPRRAENGIFVHTHRDKTWSAAIPVIDHVNTVEPFEDKPWLAVDSSPQSRFQGNVYVGWTRFDEYGSKDPAKRSRLYISRSINGGKSFQPGECISDGTGDCLDESNTLMGGMPAVGPKGEVYIVWSGPDGILLDRSVDGGINYGKDMLVSRNPGGWDQPVQGTMRANGLPVIGVDHSTGPRHGTLYVTWGDNRSGDLDIYCASSSDQGKIWSEPVRVNSDASKNGKSQFFPWMAIDPVDGSVNVLYYDRGHLDGTKTTVTLARSVDGGKTFTNFAVKQEAFECSANVFFGDYIGLAAHHGKVVGVYSHFTGKTELALSAILFRFKTGTLEAE